MATQSLVMPSVQRAVGPEDANLGARPGCYCWRLSSVAQLGNDTVNHMLGWGWATTSCNNGDQPFNWFALPQIDHPVIPQNLYRMSGGTDNTERFEQVGHSWIKHTFEALEDTVCGTV